MALTDQNQTGIPSATRPRVQLARPVQTGNAGRTAPSQGLSPQTVQSMVNQDRQRAAAQRAVNPQAQQATAAGEIYNPFTPAAQQTTPYVPADVAAYNLASEPSAAAYQTAQDVLDNFNKLSDDDKIIMLRAIQNGSATIDNGGQSIPATPTESIIGPNTMPTRGR